MIRGPALSATERREAHNDLGGVVVGPWAVSQLGPECCPAALSIFLSKPFLFSVLFETFEKKLQIGLIFLKKIVIFFPCQHRNSGEVF
jgi:hypothetical protein